MYVLVKNVQIVIKKEGLIIDQKALEKNPALALVVMNNPEYKEKWGHNFKEQSDARPVRKQPTVEKIIPVDIKKKELTSQTSGDSALTSQTAQTHSSANEVKSDGTNLNANDQRRESPSLGSQQSKHATEKTSSHGKR